MRSSRTCLSASQPMEMPASLSQWKSMAPSTQVCLGCIHYYISVIKSNDVVRPLSWSRHHVYVVMSHVFRQEPCLPRSLVGPRGLLCRRVLLLLLPPPQLEPALATASLHTWLRPSAPRPPPLPRALLSRPPAGHPNLGGPPFAPAPTGLPSNKYTVQWETDKNNKLLHNKYLINPVDLLAVQSRTQSPRILWQHVPKCTAMHFTRYTITYMHYTTNTHNYTCMHAHTHTQSIYTHIQMYMLNTISSAKTHWQVKSQLNLKSFILEHFVCCHFVFFFLSCVFRMIFYFIFSLYIPQIK